MNVLQELTADFTAIPGEGVSIHVDDVADGEGNVATLWIAEIAGGPLGVETLDTWYLPPGFERDGGQVRVHSVATGRSFWIVEAGDLARNVADYMGRELRAQFH